MRLPGRLLGLVLACLLLGITAPAWAQEVDLGVITVKQKSLADTIRQRLLRGDSFESLAKNYSVGPAAARGGRLGRVPETRIRSEFKRALAGLTPGHPSGVVATEEGFNILMRFDAAPSLAAPAPAPRPQAATAPTPLAPAPSRPPVAVDTPQLAARLEVMAGLEKLSLGELKPAEAALSKALGHNPSEDSAMFLLELVRAGLGGHLQTKALTSFAQGFLAMFDGRVDAALVSFRQARQADDRLWQATLFEANLLAGSGQAQKAVVILNDLIKQHPKAARAYVSLGMIKLDMHQVEEGVGYLRQALALDPNLAEAHYRLGSVALTQGDLEQAEQEFRAAVAADPYKEEAINDLGLVYASTGRSQEAEKAYLKSMELNPAYPAAHVNLGTLYAQTGRTNQAIDEFNKALALDDTLGDAHVNLAVTYTLRGEWEAAIKHADMAAQLGAELPKVLLDKLAPHRK